MNIAQAQAYVDRLFAALESKTKNAFVKAALAETDALVDAALPAVVASLPAETTVKGMVDAAFAAAEAGAGLWGGMALKVVQAEVDKLLPTLYPAA